MNMPDMQELKEVIEIALDREVAQFGPDTHLYEELGMDSIGAVAMVVEIQRRFRVRIDEAAIPHLLTPRALIDHIGSVSHDMVAP